LHFGNTPLLKTVSGVSAIACAYRGSKNRRRQIPGYAIRPMADGDHEPAIGSVEGENDLTSVMN
jgi:hypothetical protein